MTFFLLHGKRIFKKQKNTLFLGSQISAQNKISHKKIPLMPELGQSHNLMVYYLHLINKSQKIVHFSKKNFVLQFWNVPCIFPRVVMWRLCCSCNHTPWNKAPDRLLFPGWWFRRVRPNSWCHDKRMREDRFRLPGACSKPFTWKSVHTAGLGSINSCSWGRRLCCPEGNLC